ncbi:MAG: ATP synthase F1 subunit epsilon [Phycisphaerales bacterium]
MAATFRCTIVTPSESLLDEEVTYVNLPAWDGQTGVMAATSPFLTKLGAGVVQIEGSGGRKQFVLDSGFAQMQGGALTLLVDKAVAATTIDSKQAETELAAANARAVEATGAGLDERDRIERAQRLAAAKVAVSRRGR